MSIVKIEYQGHAIAYQDDGWFNATDAAAKWSKRVDHWLANKETKDYIEALCEITNTPFSGYLKTKRGAGGGTWLHPKLAVRFAQWLDPKFAVWCDAQIDGLIRGKSDWRKLRHESASSFKVMTSILAMTRAEAGKQTVGYHFSNEARLVNSMLSGEYKGMDRDSMSAGDLALLAHLEERNAILIARDFTYEDRKTALKSYAMDWRIAHGESLAAIGKAAA